MKIFIVLTLAIIIIPINVFSQQYQWPVKNGSLQNLITGTIGEFRPGRFHLGIDIAVPNTTEVHPSHRGIVSIIYTDPGYPANNLTYIMITNSGQYTLYQHIDLRGLPSPINVGSRVSNTSVIGKVLYSAPHNHFEIFKNNPRANRYGAAWTDPLEKLPAPNPSDWQNPAFYQSYEKNHDDRDIIFIPKTNGKINGTVSTQGFKLKNHVNAPNNVRLEGQVAILLHCYDRVNDSASYNAPQTIIRTIYQGGIELNNYIVTLSEVYPGLRANAGNVYNTNVYNRTYNDRIELGQYYYKTFYEQNESLISNIFNYNPPPFLYPTAFPRGVWDTRKMPDGQYKIEFSISDAAGNVQMFPYPYMDIIVDNIHPAITHNPLKIIEASQHLVIRAQISNEGFPPDVKVRYRYHNNPFWQEALLFETNMFNHYWKADLGMDDTRKNFGIDYCIQVKDSGIRYFSPIGGTNNPAKLVVYKDMPKRVFSVTNPQTMWIYKPKTGIEFKVYSADKDWNVNKSSPVFFKDLPMTNMSYSFPIGNSLSAGNYLYYITDSGQTLVSNRFIMANNTFFVPDGVIEIINEYLKTITFENVPQEIQAVRVYENGVDKSYVPIKAGNSYTVTVPNIGGNNYTAGYYIGNECVGFSGIPSINPKIAPTIELI